MGDEGPKAYETIGKIAAEIMPMECIGLYMPTRGRMSFPTPVLIDAMRTGDWIDVFDDVGSDPVFESGKSDAALQEAKREAFQTFPTFYNAFSEGRGQDHAIKFPCREDGQVEHMWLHVSSIDGDTITGKLGNEPQIIKGVRCGQILTVPFDELEDWLYIESGEMRGGYSVKVLMGEDWKPG